MLLGAQCFTIRDFLKDEAGIAQSMKKLHDMGYRAIQASGLGQIEPERLREICDENELKILVTHTNPDRILNDTAAVIREHRIYGCKYVGIGMMPERYIGSLSGLRQFLADFDRAARELHDNGMKLLYHNHFFEYQRFAGKAGIDIMAQETDPALWGFILDLFWTQFSGRCPAKQLEMLAGRVDVCHFKDMAMAGREQRTAPVLEGNLAWDEIFAACREIGVPIAMVEQDECYGKDPFDELKTSFDNLKNTGIAFA